MWFTESGVFGINHGRGIVVGDFFLRSVVFFGCLCVVLNDLIGLCLGCCCSGSWMVGVGKGSCVVDIVSVES